jgi:hypothetical protein
MIRAWTRISLCYCCKPLRKIRYSYQRVEKDSQPSRAAPRGKKKNSSRLVQIEKNLFVL